MSRQSTVDYDALAKYCTEPRSILDICVKFGVSSSQAHRVMTKLTWAKIVSSRMAVGKGAQRKVFLLVGLENENNWARKEPLLHHLPAHDPFGIAQRRHLKQKG